MNSRTVAELNLYDHAVSVCGAPFVLRDETGISVAPESAAQVSAVLRFCDAHRLPVTIEGAGTKQAWLNGAPAAVRLRTSRLSAVLEHSWQDMTCTVQAGCPWDALQAVLGQHGQFVALDPLWRSRSTVGGIIAANDSGALRLRYGGLRDLLIGMTVVLADGTVARSGGKVVKNVAGYDLPKLMCGSFGTLACITEVTLRLHATARHTANYTVEAAAVQPVRDVMLKVLHSTLSTQSMQLRGSAGGYALDIRLAASADVLSEQTEVLASLASSAGAALASADASLWTAREDLFAASGQSLVFKASVLPTQTADVVQAIVEHSGTAVAQATGLITGRVPMESADALLKLRAQVESVAGSLVLLGIPAGIAFERWGRLPASLPLMRAVKCQFDPHNILNPQRFLGAI